MRRILLVTILGVLAVVVVALIWQLGQTPGDKPRAMADQAVRAAEPANGAAKPQPAHAAPTTATADAPLPPSTPTGGVRKLTAAERSQAIAAIGAANAKTAAANAPAPLPEVALSKEQVRTAYRELIPLLAECYQAEIDKTPSTPAYEVTVESEFIGAEDIGTLIDEQTFAIKAVPPLPAELAQCLRETALSVQLPAIADGHSMRVTYPFTFRNE